MFIKIDYSYTVRGKRVQSSYSIHQDEHAEIARVMKEAQILAMAKPDFQISLRS